MKKNVLIIDDSALMRRVLSDVIKSNDHFQVAGFAADGVEALNMVMQKAREYDILILDINMPNMDGLEFLRELNKRQIKVKVIVVSTLAVAGAAETIRALELGAFDFVTKPNSLTETRGDSFQRRLLQTLEAAALEPASTAGMEKPANPVRQMNHLVRTRKNVKNGNRLVALACSTGGPKALQEVIPRLPENLNAPVLVVQHMPEGFTNSLAVRLNDLSSIAVKEAENEEMLKKGTVYIAKGGKQMHLGKSQLGRYVIKLLDEPPRNSLRPCADIMYESLMGSEFEEIICVVLTGMGGDGSAGIMKLSEYNPVKVIAQDAQTCVVYGMPKVIYETGMVDKVLPITEIANAITKYVGVELSKSLSTC